MNEVALSNNLQQIEREITHHKQRAGESIWEIGRRLNHVKENDLAHGEFMTWYKSMDLTEDFVSKSTRIAKELSNFESSRNLGIEALYLIATLPEGEREKEHKLVSGETKKAHEMTVRELQEVRRRNRQMEKELAKLKDDTVSADEIKERLRQQEIEAQRNKQELEQARKELANASKPEVEYVEVEKHVDNTDYDRMRELERKAENAERERKKAVEEAIRLKEAEEARLEEIRKEEERKEELKKHREEVSKNVKEIPIPDGKYDVIYCDPPWRYDFAETSNRKIENQYPTMTVEQMAELEIPADDNAVIYMWATAPKLKEALKLMDAWGFEYKTNAVWDKEIIGMGYWFRGQHELLLVGVKGQYSPPAADKRYSSVVEERRTKHSAKPLKVYDMIEDMFPSSKYIELFSRNKHNENWEAWGNQL